MRYKIFVFILAFFLAILIYIVSGNGNVGNGHKKPLPHYSNIFIQQIAKNYQDQETKMVEAKADKTIMKPKKIVKEYWDVPLSYKLQDYIHELCVQYGVDEELAYAVMQVESGFDPNKISQTKDYGLFQINVINFNRLEEQLGITNFLDPFQSAKAGIYILSELQRQSSDRNFILTAYNRGVGGAMALKSRSGNFLTGYSQKVQTTIPTIKKILVEVGD